MTLDPANPLYLMLAVECIVMLLAGSAAMLIVGTRHKHRVREAARQLANTVTRDEPQRRATLEALFRDAYGMEGDDLQAKVAEFVAREKAFYKTLLAVYLNQDGQQLARFTEALDAVVAPCLEMLPAGVELMKESLSELQVQNTHLAEELTSTKAIMDELMSEYRAAFEKHRQVNGEPDDAETDIVRSQTADADIEALPPEAIPPGPKQGSPAPGDAADDREPPADPDAAAPAAAAAG